jgi:hypothetical protein
MSTCNTCHLSCYPCPCCKEALKHAEAKFVEAQAEVEQLRELADLLRGKNHVLEMDADEAREERSRSDQACAELSDIARKHRERTEQAEGKLAQVVEAGERAQSRLLLLAGVLSRQKDRYAAVKYSEDLAAALAAVKEGE